MFSFTLETNPSHFAGRAGIIKTRRGTIHTPVFMPVGTLGAVKGILHSQLEDIGCEIILANLYHPLDHFHYLD